MLDEIFERVVDDLCERVPAYWRPRIIAASVSPLGWRLNLYAGTAVRAVSSLVSQVHTDEGLELFMQDAMLRGSGVFPQLRRFERACLRFGAAVLSVCRRGRFAAALFLVLLAALCVCASGGARAAACAASLCLWWLSLAMEEEYPPVAAGVRQSYLAATLLRGACMLPLLLSFFSSYAHLGVQSNVVLQGAMVITLFLHAALFLSLIAFNRRQPPFLRALSGVLGFVPALTAAAAIAAAVASLGEGIVPATSAVLGAAGALLAFAGDETVSLTALGALRPRFGYLYTFLLPVLGFALMLGGAWLAAI